MKMFLTAAAAAPLLIACTTASADEAQLAGRDNEARVLLINGQEYVIEDSGDAGRIVASVLGDDADDFDFDFDFEFDRAGWSEAERAEFEAEMEALASEISEMTQAMTVVRIEDDEHIRVRISRMEAMGEAHGERMREHAERMAERTLERAGAMAARAEVHGERMRIAGLSAGLNGMEAGLAGIDRALERGWVREDGERRELTGEEIGELREARADLAEDLEEFRAEHAGILTLLENDAERHAHLRRLSAEAPGAPGARAPGEGRHVRVNRRNGEARVWIDGEELHGAELEFWLARHGEPDAPPPPPEVPELDGGN